MAPLCRYEWYFRTSLDRWSTFFGMLFALSYPSSNRWLKEAGKLPYWRQIVVVGIPSAVAVAAFSWWYQTKFMLPKLAYVQRFAVQGWSYPWLRIL